MADKKISQLDLAAQINNDAVIPLSQENGGEETTYKALITALGAKIAEGLTFSNLATTAKNLVGAINELQAGGGGGGAAILIGTTTPSSSQGSNGNLYIKYTEGVGGADDTVDAIYVKLDGTWCEVTTDYADLLNKPSINNNTLSGNKTNSDLGIYGKTIEMSSTDPDFVADRITALESKLVYSESEKVVGEWIDGKTIYQKTITITTVYKDSSWHNTAHSISNIDKVIHIDGIIMNTSNEYYPVPNIRPAQTLDNLPVGIELNADRTNVRYMNNWLDNITKFYITLKYTKV